jgi:hypothetical protein
LETGPDISYDLPLPGEQRSGHSPALLALPQIDRSFSTGLQLNLTSAMTGLQTIFESYGRSCHAFLVVSMVGAFFIDFTNAVIITILMNIIK